MATSLVPFVSEEDYLSFDPEAAGQKFEYYAGAMYAMAGGTLRHSALVINATLIIGGAIRGTARRLFDSNLRIRIPAPGESPTRRSVYYTYPDLSVVCGAVRHTPNRQDTIENPAVLFEVLCPSTERIDRGFKLDQYRRIESLQAYVIIAQDEPRVYLHLRQPDGSWLLRDCTDPDGSLEIPPLGISIAMRDLYDQIVFPEPAESGRDLLPPANMPE